MRAESVSVAWIHKTLPYQKMSNDVLKLKITKMTALFDGMIYKSRYFNGFWFPFYRRKTRHFNSAIIEPCWSRENMLLQTLLDAAYKSIFQIDTPRFEKSVFRLHSTLFDVADDQLQRVFRSFRAAPSYSLFVTMMFHGLSPPSR